MDVPFSLEALGYKKDPNVKGRFVHPNGHPFYPVEFREHDKPNIGECTSAIAAAAYKAGADAELEEHRPDLLREEHRSKGEAAASASAFEQASNTKPMCNRELLRDKLAAPRTCSICGLGPCARDNVKL